MTQDELKALIEDLRLNHEYCPKEIILQAADELERLAQRTWVGLTNNELQPIADEYRILFGSWVEDFARAIEAKLKERNG
jgi:hypothetical protein